MRYFDYSSTSPMSEEALQAYTTCAKESYANPLSVHRLGVYADWHLHDYRQRIATQLGVQDDEIYFTGSGSEANFLAIVSLANAFSHQGTHLLTIKTEHPSILSTYQYLESQGFEVDYVDVDQQGSVCLTSLLSQIRTDTIICSIGMASSEIGTLQNIDILSEILDRHGILFHSDCVQALGKIPIDLTQVDAASFSAHKLYAPKGLGIMYVSREHHFKPFLSHVSHEYGMRPGTVDTPAVAAFTIALEHAMTVQGKLINRHQRFQTQLLSELTDRVTLVGCGVQERLPFHLGLFINGWSGQQFMLECDRIGACIAVGSACRAGQSGPPESLRALGYSKDFADQYVRVTFGEPTTDEDLSFLIETFKTLLIR
ncbi:IscS subfamily cysteine desulfurase [Shouchella sp. 1P09AA]|uniref:cysteine desulfurase family protein n=1 Tax=unclassified Shouchella TaxID=2893065 RepID=UPI0039A296BD